MNYCRDIAYFKVIALLCVSSTQELLKVYTNHMQKCDVLEAMQVTEIFKKYE